MKELSSFGEPSESAGRVDGAVVPEPTRGLGGWRGDEKQRGVQKAHSWDGWGVDWVGVRPRPSDWSELVKVAPRYYC